MQTEITETRFNEVRKVQGACSTYTIENGNWVVTQYYGQNLVSVWRKRNAYTGEVKFFEEQPEAAQ